MFNITRRRFLKTALAGAALSTVSRRAHAAEETTWTNWSEAVTATPENFATPTTEAELLKTVRDAIARNDTVRVAGSGHSFVPLCATEETMISLDGLQGVVDIDSEKLQARVHAGTKLHAIGEPLWEAGLSLSNQGDVDRQAVAGAIGTATHGTGKDLPNMSNFAVGFRLITGTGDILECNETENRDVFKAAQVSLGTLGVMTHVTLQCEPAYKLHEKSVSVPYEEGMAQLDELIASNRNFEFFYMPRTDAMSLKTLNVTDRPDSDFVDGERSGPAYAVYPTPRNAKFNEIEFAMPAENGVACLEELRELCRNKYDGAVWPIEYRTIKGDDIPLSPHYGRDSVAISCHQSYRRPHETFFKDCQAIYLNHGGRPHWGKMHWLTAPQLQEMYPHWQDFQKIRQQLDPKGRYLNEYTRTLFLS